MLSDGWGVVATVLGIIYDVAENSDGIGVGADALVDVGLIGGADDQVSGIEIAALVRALMGGDAILLGELL